MVEFSKVAEEVKRICMEANFLLGQDMIDAFNFALERETSPLGREILTQLIENAKIAKEKQLPMCQDTGTMVFFVELGEEVRVEGRGLQEAIMKGVDDATREGYLRNSLVGDPLRRKVLGGNNPPMVTLELAKGDRLRVMMLAKGSGCENMSALKMLTPGEGVGGVKEFVVRAVKEAHGNPCPPLIVGVGLGGNFEKCALLSKKALFRKVGVRHPDPFYAQLELELLDEINKLGIGPMGLGGMNTALDVHVEVMPCHIASLPVAVNIDCHAHRFKEFTL